MTYTVHLDDRTVSTHEAPTEAQWHASMMAVACRRH